MNNLTLAIVDHFLADFFDIVENITDLGGKIAAGVTVDDFFQVVGQAFVTVLVHGEQEDRGTKARINALAFDGIGNQFSQFQRRNDFERNQAAVNHAKRHGLRQGRDRHANRFCTPGFNHP